jgi:MFS family permease
MNNTNSPLESGSDSYVKRLVYLFGFVYFAQGIAQSAGLISQPLNFYLKEVMHFNETEATNYLAILTLPWIIKPLYGLISDFIPIFGYRRKSWLLLLNLASCLSFLWMTNLINGGPLILALLFTAVGTAASDVIIDALMVENGQKYHMLSRFQAVQWFWFYAAQIATSLLGGQLAEMSDPGTGLRTAALITMVAPACVAIACWLTIKEEKTSINLEQLKATTKGLVQAFKSRILWAAMLFLAFWNFSPSLGTPMYYYMTDVLKFSQSTIGQLGAYGSVGSIIGAWIYGRYISRHNLAFQLSFSIVGGTIGTLAYLAAVIPNSHSQLIMQALSFSFGIVSMIAVLTTLTLAGKACPQKAEGFTFAALMSVTNGFAQLSAICGSWMFVNWFDRSLVPLILLSAATTLFCFVLLPTLKGLTGRSG